MASLYVGNLDPECTEAVLYKIFAPIGNLLSIRLCKRSKTMECVGYGFINYASKIDAETAMIKLNYQMLKGRPMRLMLAVKDIRKLPIEANIFLKNLDFNMDERNLYDIFANYGNILSLKLVRNNDGFSKGFGFIQFADVKSAENAIQKVNEKLLRGKIVHVSKFLPQDKRELTNMPEFKNIYIKNFDQDISDEDLVGLCKRYGEINSAKVMLDEEGNSKCFGFVAFKNPECAKEAVKELHGMMYHGRRLYASKAKKKRERQREIKENFERKLQEMEQSSAMSV